MNNFPPQMINKQPDFHSDAYRDAYSRINGVVVIGETLADRHFRSLAKSIPDDHDLLLSLAAMESRHAVDFVGCGRNLSIRADTSLARKLFDPLHKLFRECELNGNLAGCLVIQGLIIESFAIAAYQEYLPVADPYAQPITELVLHDEEQHINYAECWLKAHFKEAKNEVSSICSKALPITLSILQTLTNDMRTIGMNPIELIASFSERFQSALETVGYKGSSARRLIMRSTLSVPLT